MDLEELHANLTPLMTFLTVARLGKFTAAADSLGINHATVSRRIAGLEKITGDRLLIRSVNGWETTNAGRRVQQIAEQIERSLAELVPEASSTVSGTIRIGAPDAFAVQIATPVLAQVQTEHPDLSVELFSSTQRARQNRSGLDLEIVLGRHDVPRSLIRPMISYQLGLYASRDYLRKNPAPSSMEHLQNHRLNYYVEPVLSVDELGSARSRLPAMRSGISSTNVFSHVSATLAGAGIGLLPSFIAYELDELVPVLADEFTHEATYYAIVREEAMRSPAVSEVYNALRRFAQQAHNDYGFIAN